MTHGHAGDGAMTQRWSWLTARFAALYHRAAIVDLGSGGAGEAPSMPSSLATLTKDAVTSYQCLLAQKMSQMFTCFHLN